MILSIDLEEAYTMEKKKILSLQHQRNVRTCKGQGSKPGHEPTSCSTVWLAMEE